MGSSATASALNAPHAPSDETHISALRCLIVDVQTTGASPKHGSLIEISWGVLLGDAQAVSEGEIKGQVKRSPEVEGLREHLVRPPRGLKIPKVVVELTGIKKSQLKSARPPAEVAAELWSALIEISQEARSGVPWVWLAHLARFERSFITPLLRAHPPPNLSAEEVQSFIEGLPWVCTHAISQRRLPTAPRRTIAAMSGLFDGPRLKLKRARPHVEATAHIWRGLSARCDDEGITTWGELKRDLETPAKRQAFQAPLARQKRLSAPQLPGVYQLLDRRDTTIYVGVASDLKRRVNQHFQGRKHHDERHLELITLVDDVRWQTTATHLEALILENREIKRLNPHYNRALTQLDLPLYLDLDRESLDQLDTPSDTQHWGPWVDRRLLESLEVVNLASLGDLSAIHRGSWPAASVDEWRVFVKGLVEGVEGVKAERDDGASCFKEVSLTWRWWYQVIKRLERDLEGALESPLDGEALTSLIEVRFASRLNLGASDLPMRFVTLLSALFQASRLVSVAPMYAHGTLIWRADRGGGLQGWRELELGVERPLKSEHRAGPPLDAAPLTSRELTQLNPPHLATRLAYDEARLIARFVGRQLNRGAKVYWRAPHSADEERASVYQLTQRLRGVTVGATAGVTEGEADAAEPNQDS